MISDFPTLGAVPVGASETMFTIWAPRQKRLRIRFVQGGRVAEMKSGEDGYHSLVANAPAGALYELILDDDRVRPDPASRAQPQGVHGPSMVVAPPELHERPPFLNPALRHHVIYEMHVGTFTPEGTFAAIIPRLPELKDLGVTALELMPIAQFPGERNWGYDGVCLFAAQWSYGGIDGLAALIDACHRHGLAVFLDVVYNHLGPEGNYLADFGPYFTDKYRTPWGAALNFDGPQSDHVREFFIQNSLYWTGKCGFDGLRLDAVHAILDHSAIPFVGQLARRNHEESDRLGRRVLIIAESGDNDPRLVRSPSVGGLGLDGCWNDDYHHAIRSALTGERRGYYRSFGSPSQIAKAIHDRYVFAGEYSASAERRYGAPARDIDHSALVVFTQNHDQVGNRPLGDRLDGTAGADGARLAAMLVLLSPFTPMLWMGEEYAEASPFQYFVSHGDEALIAATRDGRAAEFAEFISGANVPDPQDPATFQRSKLNWKLRGQGAHQKMLAFYRELIRLRRELVLRRSHQDLHAHIQGRTVILSYGRPPDVMILANVDSQDASVRVADPFSGIMPPLEVILNSDDERWGGAGRSPDRRKSDDGEFITLKPRMSLLLAAPRGRK